MMSLFSLEQFQTQFQQFLASNPQYLEARELFDINPAKNHWLGGGFIYRNLLRMVHGLQQIPDADLDVLVDTGKPGPKEPLNVPSGWMEEKTGFGCPRLITATGRQIDYIYLDEIVDLRINKLEYTVENFLTITPLTIQSVIYNIEQQKLMGDLGIEAIANKEIKINFPRRARFAAKRRGMTMMEYLQSKAAALHKEMKVVG
jgi:hypothetical protein